jgi:hypothetical protein
MDPTILASATEALGKTCFAIYTFCNNAQRINSTLDGLDHQIHLLSQVLHDITRSLSSPELCRAAFEGETGLEEQHWVRVHKVVSECHGRLKEFEHLLQSFGTRGSGFLSRARAQAKFSLNAQYVKELKEYVSVSQNTLQLEMQLITQ